MVSNFNYCPLVWYFPGRESINIMQKIQERALRYVLNVSTSDYNTLLSTCGVDCFRMSSLKAMAVEMYKILNDKSPDYLSLFSISSFHILFEIMINWSNKNENDNLWNQFIFLPWRSFMEFAANWYKKCLNFNNF